MKYFEKYFFAIYILVLVVICGFWFKSCVSSTKEDTRIIDSLKKETGYLLQDLAITRTSYNKTIVENDFLKKETKDLKKDIQKLKQIKKPSKPKVTKGSAIDSTSKDSSFVLASDYDKLEVKFDSLNTQYDSCLFYANKLLVIIDKKDRLIVKKDSLNARQNKDFDKLLEIDEEFLKQEYKRGIRKGRKQGIIFGWITETLALIGINRVR